MLGLEQGAIAFGRDDPASKADADRIDWSLRGIERRSRVAHLSRLLDFQLALISSGKLDPAAFGRHQDHALQIIYQLREIESPWLAPEGPVAATSDQAKVYERHVGHEIGSPEYDAAIEQTLRYLRSLPRSQR